MFSKIAFLLAFGLLPKAFGVYDCDPVLDGSHIVLATDFDGTIAQNSRVEQSTKDAFKRLRDSGRKLVLCTGRELEDFLKVFPEIQYFDQMVMENGALLYDPQKQEETLLCQPPDQKLVNSLCERGIWPLSIGKAVIAGIRSDDNALDEELLKSEANVHVIFNKESFMILPAEVDKGFGIRAALQRLGISPQRAVGVGDAENDVALLKSCGVSAAVSNAIPELKAIARIVLERDHGRGVEDLIDRMIRHHP